MADHSPEASGGNTPGEDVQWMVVSLVVRMVVDTIRIVIRNDMCAVFDPVGLVRIAMNMAVGMVGIVIYGMANGASHVV